MRFSVQKTVAARGFTITDSETDREAHVISLEYANQVSTAMNRNPHDDEYKELFHG